MNKKLLDARGTRSASEIAQALGISEKTLSAYENTNRQPSDDTKLKIAQFYNLPVDELFTPTRHITGIKERRRAAGITQEGLADILNVSLSTIRRYDEALDKAKACHLVVLSDLFNCSIDTLLEKE